MAALQLSPGRELKDSEQGKSSKFASGAPVTLLAEAEAALCEIIYRFCALANDLASCSESWKEKKTMFKGVSLAEINEWLNGCRQKVGRFS